MKRLVFLLFAFLMMASVSFSVVSCDVLSSLEGLDPDEQEQLEEDGYVEGWTEEGDKLVYKLVVGDETYNMVYLMIFEFKGDTCVAAEMQIVFPDSLTASIFYAALDSEAKSLAEHSGNKVIVDCTEDYKDLSKAELKASIEDTDSWM